MLYVVCVFEREKGKKKYKKGHIQDSTYCFQECQCVIPFVLGDDVHRKFAMKETESKKVERRKKNETFLMS